MVAPSPDREQVDRVDRDNREQDDRENTDQSDLERPHPTRAIGRSALLRHDALAAACQVYVSEIFGVVLAR